MLRHLVIGACLLLVAPHGARADDALDEAAQMLRSQDHTDRLEALGRLEQGGVDPAAERLAIRALADADWGVQARAAQVLARIGGAAARQALLRLAVEGEVDAVRSASIEGLGALGGSAAADGLLALARASRDEGRKARALDAAGVLATPEHLGGLRPFLRSRDTAVVAAAARAVGRLARDDAARRGILSALQPVLARRADKKEFLPYVAALDGLGEADASEVRTLLVRELLAQEDDDQYVPERIARGLAAMEAEGVATTIRAALAESSKAHELQRLCRLATRVRATGASRDLQRLLRHASPVVRRAAARALGALADPPSALALALRLRDPNPGARAEILAACARVLSREDFRDLAPMVRSDASPEVRLRFVLATLDTGDADSAAALAPFLRDDDWRVASAAAAAIGTLGRGRGIDLLRPVLGHDDWRVRGGAYEGLARVRSTAVLPLLIQGLGDRVLPVRQLCRASLTALSGSDRGADARAWREWWRTNAGTFRPEDDASTAAADLEPASDASVLREAALVVVQARSDHVERVLERLEVPHDAIRAQELKDAGLTPDDVVFVNCGASIDSETQDLLRWFVNLGGTLLTSDEALVQVVEPCFPGYLSQFARANTGNMVVAANEALPGHRLTNDVFAHIAEPQWWLEEAALPLTVDAPAHCEVLVDSAVMKERYGTSALAATFRYGLGRVAHSVSHLYLQEPGLQHAAKPRERMIFAADHLGLSIETIRGLVAAGRFEGGLNDATMRRIAPDYSAFRLAVNVVRERRRWVPER